MQEIGERDIAELALDYHRRDIDWEPDLVCIGSGSHRVVYLDPDTDTVYKVGLDSANRQEVRSLAAAREAGAEYAPAASLFEIDGATVVAMPYLPDDGSMGDVNYPLFPEAADLNGGNVHANNGQFWLIDAGGL